MLTINIQADRHDFYGPLHGANLIKAELRQHMAPLGLQPRQARVVDAMSRMRPVSKVDDTLHDFPGEDAAPFFDLARKPLGGLGGYVPGANTKCEQTKTTSNA